MTDKTTNAANQGNFPSIETSSVKNEAADKIIAIIMGDEEEDNSSDSSFGVPQKLIDEAGKALANRYCFAIDGSVLEEGGDIVAVITPIRFFETEGHCSDQTGPIRHLLPDAGELMESTWELYDYESHEDSENISVDAVKHLQKLGFVWDKDFQDFIDKSLTKEIEAALNPAAAKNAPPAPKPGKPPRPN